MAGYLILSVAYTKYILLTFYLCIAYHALTHYFFFFNPPEILHVSRVERLLKIRNAPIHSASFALRYTFTVLWLQNVTQHSLAFNKSSLTRGPSLLIQQPVEA